MEWNWNLIWIPETSGVFVVEDCTLELIDASVVTFLSEKYDTDVIQKNYSEEKFVLQWEHYID